MQKQSVTLIAGIIVVLFFLPWPVLAQSARSQVESGNRAFQQQDYESSLDHYDKALEAAPDSAIVLFNRGDALYRQGKYGKAFDVFEQAAAGARENNDRMLEAQSLYNMGNSAFAAGRQAVLQTPELALDQYRKSSEYFKSAIKLAPQLSEAAYNLEVARKAAKQVEDLIRKEQQKTREQQQQEDMAKELEELQQRQRDAANQSRELDEAGQQEDTGNIAREQARKQKDITAQTRAAGEQLKQFKQKGTYSESGEKAAESVKRAVANQKEAEDNLRRNNLSGAHEKQEQASRELEKALQQLTTRAQGKEGQEHKDSGQSEVDSAKQKAQGKKQDQQTAGAEQGQQAEETPRPAGNLAGDSLEEIIREELENRKYRSETGNATGYNAVDRDW